MAEGATQIERYDRDRQVTIEADLTTATLGQAMSAIKELPALAQLPPGVRQKPAGNAELMQQVFAQFGNAIGVGVVMIYGVLVVLFRSFFQPLTILVALPLSVGGALLALLAGNDSLSISALIGILILMGIVTKNSILLVEYAIVAMREGVQRKEALLDAASKRAQPIVMTSVAMIAGMAPIAFRLGADAEFRGPMAIAVIGGLTASTLLSLLFVPVMFTLIDDLQRNVTRRLRGLITPPTDDIVGRLPYSAD
jgi:multidrug efflux pump subunit AcrB